ncbi:rho GDP-dissociation inhibitor 1 isoform X1 [Quercus suber]|uniref:rho GDP-dissociation inhibitor 1 isoform X1 n=1 Tax=Quercus suber TaxID=58331 RepID=UPI0032DFC496
MEGGKRGEEAGPSSTGGSSSSSSSACGGVGGGGDQRQEKQKEMNEKLSEVCGVVEGDEVEEEEDRDDDDDAKEDEVDAGFVPGPLVSLKEQIELDKDDDSLRRWKEKLLGCLESDLNGQMEPEVKFHSIGIISDEFGEITTPLPVDENQRGHALFTLREGSHYRLKLTFSVQHNIVSGLRYSNTVWKGGLQVTLVIFSPLSTFGHQLIKAKECWALLLLKGNHMCTPWMKRPLHLVRLQGVPTWRGSSLKMMTTDVIWNSSTPSK